MVGWEFGDKLNCLDYYQALFWYLWCVFGDIQRRKRHSILSSLFFFPLLPFPHSHLQEVQGDWSERHSMCILACLYTNKTPPKNLPFSLCSIARIWFKTCHPSLSNKHLPAQCLSPSWPLSSSFASCLRWIMFEMLLHYVKITKSIYVVAFYDRGMKEEMSLAYLLKLM